MLTIFILIVDGCAIAKYLIPQRFHQLLSVLNLTVPFLCVFLFWSDIGVILSPNSLGIAYQEKKQLQDKPIIA